jgi:uncharacterized membrane protein
MHTTKNNNQLTCTGAWICTFILLVFAACSSESEDSLPPPPPPSETCEDMNVSLVQDVLPIIQQNCAVSGCHVAGTGRVDFTIKENVIQNASLIRTNTQSGIMPPPGSGKSLTAAEKETIACWVQNGAQDN